MIELFLAFAASGWILALLMALLWARAASDRRTFLKMLTDLAKHDQEHHR